MAPIYSISLPEVFFKLQVSVSTVKVDRLTYISWSQDHQSLVENF